MEWIADPSIWAGLLTLVVLELVLGIDNLVFIAILAEKLPPAQRDRARVTGLVLAMLMRLVLLASISWLVTLTTPLFSLRGFSFSARDLIMLFGGLFLLFKATVELNERLEGKDSDNPTVDGKQIDRSDTGLVSVSLDWHTKDPAATDHVIRAYKIEYLKGDHREGIAQGSAMGPDLFKNDIHAK